MPFMPNTPPNRGISPSSTSKRRRRSSPGGDPRQATKAVYPRKRAITACQTCRGRKKKCDNARPTCGFCQKIGGVCIYHVSETASYDPASLEILDRLSTIESLLKTGDHNPSSSGHSHVPVSEVLAALECSARTTPQKALPATPLDLDFPSLSQVRTDTVLCWPALQEALSTADRYCFLDQNGKQNFTYLSPPNQEETSATDRPRMAFPRSSHFSVDREDVERLIHQFFLNANSKNPILDRNTIKHYCAELYEHGLLWNLRSCALLLACALGAVAHSWQYSPTVLDADSHATSSRYEDLELAKIYYNAAEKRLGAALRTQSTLAVQCLCLAGIFNMYILDSSGALSMFHTSGKILQTVISACQLKDVDSSRQEESSQLISRLYWTCFKSERELLGEFPIGHLALTQLELSKRYPTPPSQNSHDSPQDPWRQLEEDSWYYYLAEIALRRITDEIVKVMFAESDRSDFSTAEFSPQQLIPAALEFERHLATWHESLPDSMAFPASPVPLDNELRYFLRSRYYLTSELLYRPFLCYTIHRPEDSSLEVHEFSQKGLVFASNYLTQWNHTHSHHGKWLQLRREVTAICILMSAFGSGMEMPRDWRSGVERAHEHIQYWSMEARYLGSWERMAMAVDEYFMGFHDLGYENRPPTEEDGRVEDGSWDQSSATLGRLQNLM